MIEKRESQKKPVSLLWPVGLGIVALLIAVIALVQVNNPAEVQTMGVTKFGSIHLSDTGGTATPVFIVDQLGTGVLAEFRDGGTPVATFLDGGAFQIGAAGLLDVNGVADGLVIDADGDTTISAPVDDTIDIEIGGADEATWTAASLDLNDTFLDQDINTENLMLPTVLQVAITYTAAAGGSGTVATITDGEIWFIYNVFVRTTTNFDATGDDATLDIGDGNDVDGFIDAADANIQATFTEGTGYQAGFYGIENGSGGAYTLDDGGPFVYAPSGADETIDWAVGEVSGTTLSAGAATIYVVYIRIQ